MSCKKGTIEIDNNRLMRESQSRAIFRFAAFFGSARTGCMCLNRSCLLLDAES